MVVFSNSRVLGYMREVNEFLKGTWSIHVSSRFGFHDSFPVSFYTVTGGVRVGDAVLCVEGSSVPIIARPRGQAFNIIVIVASLSSNDLIHSFYKGHIFEMQLI